MAADTVTQFFIEITPDSNKEDELINLVTDVPETKERTLIFVETRRMADVLAAKLSGIGNVEKIEDFEVDTLDF